MRIGSDERTLLARLFGVLAAGEALAEDCAKGQARLAVDGRSRRFFLAQARQEALHRKVFEGTLLWLRPRGCRSVAHNPSLRAYRTLLLGALDRGDLAETLLAQQVVMEGLGEAVLEQLDEGVSTRGLGYSAIRRTLLRQEHAHHRFGLRALQRLVQHDPLAKDRLRQRAEDYLALSDALLKSHAALFEFFEEDPAVYVRNARRDLPEWLMVQAP